MGASRRRGFTLIEISMVIAIIGLILVLGALRMDALTPERSLVSASRVMRAGLEEMRHAVLLRGEAADLVYDLGKGSFALETGTSSGPEVLLESRLPEGVGLKRIQRLGLPDATEGILRLRLAAGGACPAHVLTLGAEGTAVERILRVDPLLSTVTILDQAKPFAELFPVIPDEREPVGP